MKTNNIDRAEYISRIVGNPNMQSVYDTLFTMYRTAGGTEERFDSIYSLVLALQTVSGGMDISLLQEIYYAITGEETQETDPETLTQIIIDLVSNMSSYKAGKNIEINNDYISAKGYIIKNDAFIEVPNIVTEQSSIYIVDSSVEGYRYMAEYWDINNFLNVRLIVDNVEILIQDYKVIEYEGEVATVFNCAVDLPVETDIDISIDILPRAYEGCHVEGLTYPAPYTGSRINAAVGAYSHVEGANNISRGKLNHVEGWENTIDGNADQYHTNHVEGRYNRLTLSDTSFTTPTELCSNHVEGYQNQVHDIRGSHIEGCQNQCNFGGMMLHMEGNSNVINAANSNVSHTEGANNRINGNNFKYGHMEGFGNRYAASNSEACHIEGYNNEITESVRNIVGGHLEGVGNQIHNTAESACGSYNCSHTPVNHDYEGTLFSIGDGDTSVRLNALEILRDGSLYIQGLGGYGGIDTTVQNPNIMSIQDYINSLERRIYNLEHPIQ